MSETGEHPPDVLVDLEGVDSRALRHTLETALREQIQQGQLVAGTALPPSRVLADQLGVSRSVVVAAYANLTADGYLDARQGRGTRVRKRDPVAQDAPDAPDLSAYFGPSPSAALLRAPAPIRLLGGLPDLSLFPRRAWVRHYDAAISALTDAELGYPDERGTESLRLALTAYLSRVRGITTSAERIVVTSGITQGMALACRLMRRAGVRAVAIEDPSFVLHRAIVRDHGLTVIPIPVDSEGMDVEALAASTAEAVITVPAHSYPTGATLSERRRRALIAWARRHDAIVIEDDYDSELRYDRSPIAALQRRAPERVISLGSLSKTLTPTLRLGWAVTPAAWAETLADDKQLADMGSGGVEQHALASFLDSGEYGRHLRRVRPVYRRRRDAAIEALAALLPDARWTGEAAGLNLYVEFPGVDVHALAVRALEHGVLLEDAARHFAAPAHAPPAIVLGYGGQPEETLRRGLAIVAAALDQ